MRDTEPREGPAARPWLLAAALLLLPLGVACTPSADAHRFSQGTPGAEDLNIWTAQISGSESRIWIEAFDL
ncbi:hypothetical protein [Streptomyces sp. NPDC003943]